MWHLIWVCTVCLWPFYGFRGKNGWKQNIYHLSNNKLSIGHTSTRLFTIAIKSTWLRCLDIQFSIWKKNKTFLYHTLWIICNFSYSEMEKFRLFPSALDAMSFMFSQLAYSIDFVRSLRKSWLKKLFMIYDVVCYFIFHNSKPEQDKFALGWTVCKMVTN